ncbi:MAG: DUF547 domain-containing protein [Acidiferrobacterales bacterium]|nr:DUF547 domain-containing protein [Acidiferrobacterales bacterium]
MKSLTLGCCNGYERDWNKISRALIFNFAAFCFAFFTLGEVQAAPKSSEIRFWNDSEEQSVLEPDYSQWAEFLEKYVVPNADQDINRLRYSEVTEDDKNALDDFVDYLQKMDPRQLNKQRQKAYWLNLFNVRIVQRVLDEEPESSIKELGRGLWRNKGLYISMQKTSLNDIEHGILRPIFKDPRVHFSLMAGTEGSANILPQPFDGDNVEALLEQNTREFLNHERGVSIEQDKVTISTIFKWYRNDFGGSVESVKTFILPYLDSDKAEALSNASKIDYDYSWKLNQKTS